MRTKITCEVFLALLFVSTLSLVVRIQQVKAWNGTVQIHADGSVNPPAAPIQRSGNVYKLTDNIISDGDGIVIEGNSITVDGNGYTIQGSYGGNGVDLTGTSSVTVKNANVQGFSIGIFAPSSHYNTITSNNIEENSISGIWLDGSSNNNIIGNSIGQNSAYGIWVSSSSNNNIYHNNFANNAVQAYTTYDSINTWDAGYPVAGNYWSDYTGTDLYSGPFQNQTGSDGIGDTSSVLDPNNVDHYPLITPLTHDIGITSVSTSKTVVGQGYSINISVQIINYGAQTEIFDLTIKADSIIMQTQEVTLAAQTSETKTYTLDTSSIPKGNHTISAYADAVPGETDTADNTLTDGLISVTIQGDVNGDCVVDIFDIVRIALAMGSKPNDPSWDPNADINNDGIIDIFDIVIVAIHFGEVAL
jgi:parallel beta-helix repeat protein